MRTIAGVLGWSLLVELSGDAFAQPPPPIDTRIAPATVSAVMTKCPASGKKSKCVDVENCIVYIETDKKAEYSYDLSALSSAYASHASLFVHSSVGVTDTTLAGLAIRQKAQEEDTSTTLMFAGVPLSSEFVCPICVRPALLAAKSRSNQPLLARVP